MTPEEKYTLHLFGCGAMGKRPELPPSDLDFSLVPEIAKEQSVTLAVAKALHDNPDVFVPEETKSTFKNHLSASAKRSGVRMAKVLALLEMLEGEMPYVLLKGYCFARLYACPECRESVDTDILIWKQDERKAMDFFRKQGFKVMTRKKDEHHFRCFHRTFGTFEVHIRFWQNSYDKLLFGDRLSVESAMQNAVRVQTPFGCFRKLSLRDELLFSTFHFLKHFLFKGVTIRRILDIALLVAAAEREEDLSWYREVLTELRFLKTMQVMLYVAAENLSAPETNLMQAAPEEAEKVLSDVLRAGYNGRRETAARTAHYEKYVLSRAKEKYGKSRARLLLFSQNFKERFFVVFPSVQELSKRYRVLRKCKFLYPVLALYRLATDGMKRLFAQKKSSPSANTDREELFQILEL